MPESLAVPVSLVALAVALAALAIGLWLGGRDRPKREALPLPALVDIDALEAHLSDQQDRLLSMADLVQAIDKRSDELESGSRRAVQHVGLVRYNPFEDTGSNQSFVLALLDGDANGIILTSLHSRQQTRVYLKEIVGGRCDAPLSGEETEALKRAGIAA